MRRLAGIAALAVVLTGCTSSPTTTTVDVVPPPPSPTTSTTPRPATVPPRQVETFIEPIQGFLPDGTDYTIYLQTSSPEDLVDVIAWVMFEADGGVWAVEVDFVPGRVEESSMSPDGKYVVDTGLFWHAEIQFFEDGLSALGADVEQIIESGITGSSFDRGYPGLILEAPFRWATTHDPTPPMTVRFETIEVTVGCGTEAAACTWQESLQVLRRPGYAASGVTMESFSNRSLADPFYLDRGPLLDGRSFPSVVWTGEEMIVWGGFKNEVDWHVDGAAYDPETGAWRLLAPSPIPINTRSHAIWDGDEMIVVSREGTFAYSPETDSWTEIGERVSVSHHDPVAVAVDGEVYAWATPWVVELERDTGEWVPLPDPLPIREVWYRSFRDFDGRLLLTAGSQEVCSGRRFLVWDGTTWNELPEVSLASPTFADCSDVNQVGVVDGEVVIWGLPDVETRVYSDSTGQWTTAGIPMLSGSEGPSGPVDIDGRLLVPEWSLGSIFDPVDLTWTAVEFPGQADANSMVWTGAEILAWVGSLDDAWRWTPPE